VQAGREFFVPRLLLVDDDPVLLAARSAVLRSAGFDVSGAQSGNEALALLQGVAAGFSWQMVITDHVMPGRNGLDFVRELRRLHPFMPVMVVSGYGDSEKGYEGLDVEFLHKPCLPEELIARVRGILAQDQNSRCD
jgi:DNA-binding response OmpR family regulator